MPLRIWEMVVAAWCLAPRGFQLNRDVIASMTTYNIQFAPRVHDGRHIRERDSRVEIERVERCSGMSAAIGAAAIARRIQDEPAFGNVDGHQVRWTREISGNLTGRRPLLWQSMQAGRIRQR